MGAKLMTVESMDSTVRLFSLSQTQISYQRVHGHNEIIINLPWGMNTVSIKNYIVSVGPSMKISPTRAIFKLSIYDI